LKAITPKATRWINQHPLMKLPVGKEYKKLCGHCKPTLAKIKGFLFQKYSDKFTPKHFKRITTPLNNIEEYTKYIGKGVDNIYYVANRKIAVEDKYCKGRIKMAYVLKDWIPRFWNNVNGDPLEEVHEKIVRINGDMKISKRIRNFLYACGVRVITAQKFIAYLSNISSITSIDNPYSCSHISSFSSSSPFYCLSSTFACNRLFSLIDYDC